MSVHRLLLQDLLARLSWRLAPLIALMAIVGFGEGATVALLLPLLSRIGIAAPGQQNFANRLLDDGLATMGATTLWQILIVVLVVAALQAASSITLNWWITKLARRYQSRRQMELFRAFIEARWSFVVEHKVGDLTSTIVNECERLGTAYTMLLSAISTTVVAVMYFGLALLIAWKAVICLALFGVVTAVGMTRLYKLSYDSGRLIAPLSADLQSQLVEQFAAFKLLKATASEERAAARIEPILHRLEWAYALNSFLPMTVRSVLEFMAFVSLAVVIVLASGGIGVAVGNVVVVLALFARLFPRMTALQANLHYLNGYVHAIETINQFQEDAAANAEPQENSAPLPTVHLPTTLALSRFTVVLGGRAVLDDVDMQIPVPGLTALVGASGAGKSTLVHALLGLVEPNAGAITLERLDMQSVPLRGWRQLIGYVPQETLLFHASIRENVTLANPTASESEIDLALRRAHAHDFVGALPEGMDTVIGSQGVKLSGGQRQRLGIARALLSNPVLLLMDEAMSALDSESEAEILRTLDGLRQTMGIALIAHRLGAIRSADNICVLEAGRVVENGTWDELMARRARLFAFVNAQTGVDHRLTEAAGAAIG